MNRISILLSTYNGGKYLKEQLDSILSQSFNDFKVLVRDDGSTDNTVAILKEYEKMYPTKINLIKDDGGNLRSTRSFMRLLENSDSEYVMFCDQDDVWLPEKVERTLKKIIEMKQEFGDIPLLVHTDLVVVDENLSIINNSFFNFQKIDPYKDSFNNLLMQNVITGCTVMINKKLVQKCLPISDGVIIHDWWAGLVASKFGRIGYLSQATIQYRQHVDNVVGAKGFTIRAVFRKIYVLFTSDIIKQYQKQANAFLKQFRDELDDETIKMLEDFAILEQKNWLQRRVILLKYKLLKQGFIRNIGLFLKI